MEAYQVAHMGITEERAKFWDLFKHRRLVICFTCMAVNFFSCGMGFYGVSQFIGQMSGNIHKNVFISGAMLIPATLSATAFLYYLNRRTFLMSTSLASGTILLVLVLIIPDDLTVFRVILACSANCFYFMSFITAFLFGVELFPTSIRNSVLGCLAVMSRLGQILAPMINQLPEKLPGCIFGGIAIVGGILCIPLPETKNKELPSSLEAFGTSAAAAPGGKTVNIQL